MSLDAMYVWTFWILAGIAFCLFTGCVSIGHAQRMVQVEHRKTQACQEMLQDEMRANDNKKQAERDKQPEYKIEWEK